jgi:uncharacterized membrane protein YcaP (DUF421 family)
VFFDDWAGLGRTLVVGSLAYLAMVLLLRVSGKRTLSKMNAFDFIVTVALGSALANVLLSEDVALAEGLVAFALLIGAQYCITFLSVRSKAVRALIKGEPTLLFHGGSFLGSAMQRERVTEEEVLAAVRQQGKGTLSEVAAVVLETDGTFSILSRAGEGADSSLRNVSLRER